MAFQANAFQFNAFQVRTPAVNLTGHDPFNAGGPLSGGSFTRWQWRALKQEIAAEQRQERQGRAERELDGYLRLSKAFPAKPRDKDGQRETAAAERRAHAAKIMQDSLTANMRAIDQRLRRQAALCVQAQRQQEEEALALLLMDD